MGKPTLLSNKIILVTRPAGREKNLRALITQAGGTSIHYPVIRIQPPLDSEALAQLQPQLNSFTMAIFISPTAVEQSLHYFPHLPEHFIIVSIGSKTSITLESHKHHVDIEAPGHNTESLLEMAAFQSSELQEQRILIFRGNGGRSLLGDSLRQRGAEVHYVETYRRGIPQQPALTSKQIKSLAAITVSSNEGLTNLLTLMHGPDPLVDTPLIVPSKRAAELAKQHGFKTIIKADNASDEATIRALKRFIA